MSQHTFGALAVGLAALVLGALWLVGAVARLRRRGEMATNLGSSASGIYTYTIAQVGCAAAIAVAGVALIGLAFLR